MTLAATAISVHGRGGGHEPGGGGPQFGDLVGARVTLGQMPFEVGSLRFGEHVEGVGQGVDVRFPGLSRHACSFHQRVFGAEPFSDASNPRLPLNRILTEGRCAPLDPDPPEAASWVVGSVQDVPRELPVAWFTSAQSLKAWSASVILILVLAQLTTALWMYGRLPGCLFYGAFTAKMIGLRSRRPPGWGIAILGGTVFTLFVVLWALSALWWFDSAGLNW